MGRPPEEAQVRGLRDYFVPGSAASRRSREVIALCDSWLAQGRVIANVEAALSELEEVGSDPAPLKVVRFALAGGETETPAAMTCQWLIERGQPEGLANPVWLENSLDHPATHKSWTADAWQAAMFPGRAEAESYIADNALDARAVEHGFMHSEDPR